MTDEKTGEFRSGEFTDIYLAKPFPIGTADCSGQRAVKERIRADLRQKFAAFTPNSPVELDYDSVGEGRAVLIGIEPVAKK